MKDECSTKGLPTVELVVDDPYPRIGELRNLQDIQADHDPKAAKTKVDDFIGLEKGRLAFCYFAKFLLQAGGGTETSGSFPWSYLSCHQSWTVSVRTVPAQFGKRRGEAIRQYGKFITRCSATVIVCIGRCRKAIDGGRAFLSALLPG